MLLNPKKLFYSISILLISIPFCVQLQAQSAYAGNASVVSEYSPDVFPLVHKGQAAPVYVDAGDAEVVKIAAEAFLKDMEQVTGQVPELRYNQEEMTQYPVIIGTLGQSDVIDQLAKRKESSLGALKGKWETFSISVIEQPFGKVKKALVIAGSDRRGTAFGVFELSKLIGVSPWYWWADVSPAQQDNLYVTAGTRLQGPPSVKYRGIFLNDEDWGLQPWAAQNIDTDVKDIGPKTYAKIFELLLRLKANLIWPAMHPSTKAFFHYPANPKVADDYAIVVGTSHAEPMLRNNVDEWDKESMGPFDYIRNKETVYNYWDKRVQESRGIEAVYTVGMRGVHDSGMQGVDGASEAAEVLEQIIADQREMLHTHIDSEVSSIPQAFTAYKEVLDVYDHGLELPEDITLVWPDDNYGYIRRLSNSKEQERPGGSGVYYHASYWGRPHDYLWLSSTHPALIREEMWKAHQMDAARLWVLNVGDIKPLEYNIELFMDMAYQMEPFSDSKYVKKHLLDWVTEIFGDDQAEAISGVLWEYYQLAFERRPEFMGWSRTEPTTQTSFTEYNHFYYGDEAQQRIDRYAELEEQVKVLRKQVKPEDGDAFYQLVYYPVVGASNMNKKFIYRDKSHYYAAQNRTSAFDYAAMARQAYENIVRETQYYNNELAGGKWKGMMDLEPRDLPVYQEPDLPEIKIEPSAELGIMSEGFVHQDSSLLHTKSRDFLLPTFTPWGPEKYFIDVFLMDENSIPWKASASDSWIKLSEKKGTLINAFGQKEQRIWVSIDRQKAPKGKELEGYVRLEGAGEITKIKVKAAEPGLQAEEDYQGFGEHNGYLSMFAENYSSKKDVSPAAWTLVEGLGHTGNSLMALPLQQDSFEDPKDIIEKAPMLAYDFYTFTDAAPVLHISSLPTHPVTSKHQLRLAVAIDDGPLKMVDFQTFGRSEEWKENVLRNSTLSEISYPEIKKGKHQLKIYMVDPGLVLDRIIIDLGGLKKNYSIIPETKKRD